MNIFQIQLPGIPTKPTMRQPTTTSNEDAYTATDSTVAMHKVTIGNKHGSAVTCTVLFYDALATTTSEVITQSVAAAETKQFEVFLPMRVDDKIQVKAATANVVTFTLEMVRNPQQSGGA